MMIPLPIQQCWPNVEDCGVLEITFSRRRRHLEVVVCFIWQVDEGRYRGIITVGPSLEIIPSDKGLTRNAMEAFLIREGYEDLSGRSIVRPYPSLNEFEYVYENKAWPSDHWEGRKIGNDV